MEKEIIEIISFGTGYQIIKYGNLCIAEDLEIGEIATVVLYNNLIVKMCVDNENSMYMGEIIEILDNSNIIIKIDESTILKIELDQECEIIKNW